MAKLIEVFKTREEICLWIEKNKAELEKTVGFKVKFISVAELGILAEVQDLKEFKIISIPDFKLSNETLQTVEGFIRGEIGGDKYVGAIILAGSINLKLDKYLSKIKYISKIFRSYILEVENDKPVFKEYEVL